MKTKAIKPNDALRRARQSKELTQSELSLVSGVSLTYIQRMENDGLVPGPGIQKRLSDTLGKTSKELFR